MGIRRGFTDKQKWRNRQHRGERGGGDIETPPPQERVKVQWRQRWSELQEELLQPRWAENCVGFGVRQSWAGSCRRGLLLLEP